MKPSLPLFRRVALVLVAGLAMGFAAAPGVAQPLKKVVVSEGIRYAAFFPLYVAIDKGFFKEQGLDVQVVSAGSRTLAVQSVIAKEALISLHDPAGPALANKKGGNLRVFLAAVNQPPAFLMVAKDRPVSGPKAFHGLNIALDQVPSLAHALVAHALREAGFTEVNQSTWAPKDSSDPKDRVNLLFGANGTQLAQVKAGRANAASVYTPVDAQAERELGMRALYSFSGKTGTFTSSAFDTLAETVEKDPDTLQKFSNAMVKTFRYVHKNPDQAVSVLQKYLPNANPADVLAVVKRLLASDAIPRNGTITKEAWDRNLNGFLKDAKDPASNTPYESIVVSRFWEKANSQPE